MTKIVTLQDGLDWVKTLDDDDLVTLPGLGGQIHCCFWAGYAKRVLGVERPTVGCSIRDDHGVVAELNPDACNFQHDFDDSFHMHDAKYKETGLRVTVRELKEKLPQYFHR